MPVLRQRLIWDISRGVPKIKERLAFGPKDNKNRLVEIKLPIPSNIIIQIIKQFTVICKSTVYIFTW